MKSRIPFVVVIWLLVDLYFFQAILTVTATTIFLWAYWLYDVLVGLSVLYFAFSRNLTRKYAGLFSALVSMVLISLVPKLCGIPVLLIEDITRLFRGFPARSLWVSYLAMGIAAIPFLSLMFGLTQGRHYYKVHRETLYFDDLPEAFDGFTITQLSDIHSGSFTSRKGVEKGLEIVNQQNSDVILFTGDLVNNLASEMDPWISAFAKLKARCGKFSVLGNHDYGDYTDNPTQDINDSRNSVLDATVTTVASTRAYSLQD